VNTAAFGRQAEADLVDELRAKGGHLVSLVAEDGGEIVGHVLLTPVAVEGSEEIFECAALGPVAVAPARQGEGIGTALIEAALTQVVALTYDVVFVLGDPSYYERFGFEPAAPHHIKPEFEDIPEDHFMVALASDDALEGIWGTVYYLPAFKSV